MARASGCFYMMILELHFCHILTSYMQFLWCYSQNSRPMPKKGKKRTQISIHTPQLLEERMVLIYQPYIYNFCGVIHQIVLLKFYPWHRVHTSTSWTKRTRRCWPLCRSLILTTCTARVMSGATLKSFAPTTKTWSQSSFQSKSGGEFPARHFTVIQCSPFFKGCPEI